MKKIIFDTYPIARFGGEDDGYHLYFNGNPIFYTDQKVEFGGEHDNFCLYYNGNPFTGILKDEMVLYFVEAEYVDGYEHGKQIIKYKTNGTIVVEAIYEEGDEIESKLFYETGEKKNIRNEKEYKLWSKAGILLIEKDYVSGIEKTYFLDGSLKSYDENESDIIKYYNKQGDCIFTSFYYFNCERKTVTDYNDEELVACYFDLIVKEKYPETYDYYVPDPNRQEQLRVFFIWKWLWNIFDKNKKLYFSIINTLMTHSDVDRLKTVASIIVIDKLESLIESKNKKNAVCYSFIEEYKACQKEDLSDIKRYYPDRESNQYYFFQV